MADARNVGSNLDTISQPNTCDFTKCRVRFLGCLREYPHAHTTLLRTPLKRWTLRLAGELLSPLAYELTDGRHEHSIDRLHSIHQGLSQQLSPAQSALRSVSAPGLKMTSNVDLAPGNPTTLFCVFVRGIPRNHSGEETIRGDGSKPQPPLLLLPLRRLPMRRSGAR
jgi:hypothetical protein